MIKEISSFRAEGDYYSPRGGSQVPQPGPSGLSKYGSSVTMLRVDGQQRKNYNKVPIAPKSGHR